MKSRSLSFLLAWLFLPFIISAQLPDTSGAAILFQQVMDSINPKHVDWVKSSAKKVNEKSKVTETEVRNMARQYVNLGGFDGADIEAVVFLVLMQASKSAQEDLKAIMASVKSINDKKKILRDALSKMKEQYAKMTRAQYDSFTLLLIKQPDVKTKTDSPTKSDIRDLKLKMKNDLDSMSEMGEMESLRLQMAMDRMSKLMSTLSNIFKKISKTAEEITQNLK